MPILRFAADFTICSRVSAMVRNVSGAKFVELDPVQARMRGACIDHSVTRSVSNSNVVAFHKGLVQEKVYFKKSTPAPKGRPFLLGCCSFVGSTETTYALLSSS